MINRINRDQIDTLTYIYMTVTFFAWYRHFNKEWRGLASLWAKPI